MRDFLKNWVLAPRLIRCACRILSRMVASRSTLERFVKRSGSLYVLANGPSLKEDIVRYRQTMSVADRLAVNFAIVNEEIIALQPTVYLLADPAFFVSLDSLAPALREKMANLREVFLSQVTWPITLVVPNDAMSSEFVGALSGKANFSIVAFWRGVPVPENIVDFKGWKANRYAPPTQNVINTALYLGIVWDYEKIVLLGADTSFHTMLRLDQRTNQPYIENEHFYGKEKQYLFKDVAHTIPQKLSEQFTCIATAFRWYDKLREFADWAGVKIINASSFSWIDAFERPRT